MPGGKTNLEENAALDRLYGSGAPALWDAALHIGNPGDDGTLNEVPVGGGYGRLAIGNGPTNFPAAAGGVKALAVQHDFAQATVAWGEILAWSLKEGGTNTTRHYGFMVDAGFVATADATDVTNNTLNQPDNAWVNGDAVRLFSIERLGSVPAGLVELTTLYFVVNRTVDTIQLALTPGGAPVDITGKGVCEVCFNRSKNIGIDDFFRFIAGQLQIFET